MEENISIRLADISDLSRLIDVGDELFDYPVRLESANEFLKDARHHMAIALLYDKVIGMASGVHYTHPDKKSSLFIDEAGVLDKYQKQGIGTKLILFLKEHGQNLGCDTAWVLTEIDNKPAQKTYVNAGGVKMQNNPVMFEFELGQVKAS
jgi:ribosomal protein S18 acetylase RimI-like enzyme